MRVLAKSTCGIVLQCKDCSKIHFAFKTSYLDLELVDFEKLCEEVYLHVQQINNHISTAIKCIKIAIQNLPGFSFVLNINELLALNKLLQNAHLIQASYQLFQNDSKN